MSKPNNTNNTNAPAITPMQRCVGSFYEKTEKAVLQDERTKEDGVPEVNE